MEEDKKIRKKESSKRKKKEKKDNDELPDLLEDSDEIVSGHNFKNVFFPKLTWCAVCREFIWGITKAQQKGSECSICHKQVHMYCMDAVFNLPCKEEPQAIQTVEAITSTKPGICSGRLTKKVGGNKIWTELQADRKLHFFRKNNDEEKEEENSFILTHETTIELLDVGVLRNKPGIKLNNPGTGLLALSETIYLENETEREEWLMHIKHALKIIKQIEEEKRAEWYWSDLKGGLEASVVDWQTPDEIKELEQRSLSTKQFHRNEEIILYHRFLNKSYGPYDLAALSDQFVARYLPIFIQMPQLIDVLHTKILANRKLKEHAYWCVKSELKMANIYLNNKGFLGETKDLDRTWQFFHNLSKQFPLEVGQSWDFEDGQICDPVWNEGHVKKIEVVKVFLSGHNPCLLLLTYHKNIEPKRIMFKDDDIRPDMMVCIVFEVLNSLWKSSGLASKPRMITFKVVPGGPGFGFMEFVENSIPIRDFDFGKVANFKGNELELFLSTAAAGYIGGFLLGIRDRHEDNLMVKDDCKFFQLDFKHSFNVKTFGIDSCRFAISSRFKRSLESVTSSKKGKWQNFKDRASAAYLVLRRNSQIIINLCRLLFGDLFEDNRIELEMLRTFYLDRTEDQAIARIQELMDLGVYSVKRIMKNVTHELSGNIKPKKSLKSLNASKDKLLEKSLSEKEEKKDKKD